ncbi:sialidase family protein [Cytophagales bacterium LB-30]|uniref:Sialidase family protein n=1 Tax=Shiella aurantiaca TaxID=3058365 RepID=A0ABT8F453_9BACT|nr:sialidase family protein [Shiella aurantiaca]MDN4165024.1 sialidase family protein [Shiella aurantiaca]
MLSRLIIIWLLLSVLGSFSVKQASHPVETSTLQYLSDERFDAEGAYFTSDAKGLPVVCWIEREPSGSVMVFSRWNAADGQFAKPIKIEASRGLTPHNENMPKLAFRKDGSLVAVFSNSRRVNRPDAMFEGEIYYIQSFDDGATWTPKSYVHSDTASGYSRGFIDIARLADGEIGAVWLDGRKKDKSGSTLYFSKTQGKKGFVTDRAISEKVCQCCRTDISVDAAGAIHIAYRDIEMGLAGNELRDMHYIVSTDQGKTFSKAQRIGADDWNISACPHTGPSIAASAQKVDFFWFTGANPSGIYHSSTTDNGKSFSDRKLISEEGKHPQALALSSSLTMLLMDETFNEGSNYFNRVVCQKVENGKPTQQLVMSKNEVDARYPVIARLSDSQWVGAWMQKSKDGKWRIVSEKKYIN